VTTESAAEFSKIWNRPISVGELENERGAVMSFIAWNAEKAPHAYRAFPKGGGAWMLGRRRGKRG